MNVIYKGKKAVLEMAEISKRYFYVMSGGETAVWKLYDDSGIKMSKTITAPENNESGMITVILSAEETADITLGAYYHYVEFENGMVTESEFIEVRKHE